uniref:Ribonuclease 3 n=1 Tax=candidate division WOR-3 bacterium TaxID=2052148 RepID=A0A7C3N5L8_UNCW3
MNDKDLQEKFKKITGIEIENVELLKESLTHRSKGESRSYERLEFLGDSILSFLTSEYLYKKLKDINEGELSKKRSEIVNRENLSFIFSKLFFDELIFVDRKSLKSIPDSIKEDIIESVFGAIYIEKGIRGAKRFFKLILKNSKEMPDDFYAKNRLQELSLSRYKKLPEFRTEVYRDDKFRCKVYLDGKYYSQSVGRSKKESEKKAAKLAIKKIEKENL